MNNFAEQQINQKENLPYGDNFSLHDDFEDFKFNSKLGTDNNQTYSNEQNTDIFLMKPENNLNGDGIFLSSFFGNDFYQGMDNVCLF